MMVARLTALIGMLFALAACSNNPPKQITEPWFAHCANIENIGVLSAVRIAFFGELHGTTEAPQFVGEVVCHLASKHHPVVLALELPADMQPLVTKFMDRPVDNGAEAAELTAHPFWLSGDPDGRSSIAMLRLIQRARDLRQHGLPVSVFMFDKSMNEKLLGSAREQRLAANLRSRLQNLPSGGKIIVLTGNLHSRSESGVPWNAAFEPAAYLLKDTKPLSFDLVHLGGASWNCTQDGCAMSTSRPNLPEAFTEVLPGIYKRERTRGHDGVYFVGKISASLPLIPRTASAQ